MSKEPDQHTHDEGIYPVVPGHAVPEPIPFVPFQPWHLPRKQWVRRRQWQECTHRLVSKLQLGDRPLRYLGLPGTELLDLEVLANYCAERGLRFRYLGFNSGAQSPGQRTTQQLAEDLLKSMDAVDAGSIVASDNILALASKTGVAFQRLRDYESFDVINLDLCDVFTTRQGRSVHGAVRNIIEYQVNGRTQPWLLFVTTAVDRDAISPDDIAKYQERFEENSDRCEQFRDIASDILGQQVLVTGAGKSAFANANGVRFGKLLSLSIGKWLAALLKQPVTWKVELKSCVCYRRGLSNMNANTLPVPEPELFSLVFGIARTLQEVADPLELAGPKESAHLINWDEVERTMALQMARKAQNALDLDLHLQDKPEEYKQLTEEAGTALSFRSYDVDAYHRFATSIPRIQATV